MAVDYDSILGVVDQPKPKPTPNAAPQFQTNDPASMRAAIVKSGDPALLSVFDRQFPSVAQGAQGSGVNYDQMSAMFTTPAQAQKMAQAQPQPQQQPPGASQAQAGRSDFLGMGAHIGTGLLSSVYGGLKGLVMLGTGSGVDAAANAVTQAQQDYTYQPPQGSDAARVAQVLDSSANPLTWPAKAGDYAGGKLAEAGYPAAGAAVNAGLSVLGAPAVLKGASMARAPISKLLNAPEAANAPRIEPTMQAAPVVQTPPANPGMTVRFSNGAEFSDKPPATAPAVEKPAYTPPPLESATPEVQQKINAAQKSGTLNPEVATRHVEASSLPVPVTLSRGQAMMDPGIISQEMNARGGKAPQVSPEFYNDQGKALAQNLDVIRQRAAPDVQAVNPTQHGQVLIDEYKKADAPVVADISAKYKALEDANGGSFPLDGKTFAANAETALDKALKSGSVPADIKSSLDAFKNGRQMTFQDFETLRSDLADVQRSSSDGRQRAAANIIRQQLEDMPLTPEAQALKPLADAARQAAKARFERLEADPAYRAAVGDSVSAGEASPLADDFVKKYIIGGKRANVLQMKQNLADSQIAQQTIPAATIDSLRKAARADVETGKFNAASYNETLNNILPKADAVLDPNSTQLVQQVGKVAKYTTAQPKGSFVNNSNTLVGVGLDVAKRGLSNMANVATGGLSGVAQDMAATAKANKAAKASTAPGAGVDSPKKLSDLPGINRDSK